MLVSRARDFLAAGPSDAVDLIAHVCQLPSPPRFVADHMAMALLAPWEEFTREGDGRWRLAPESAALSLPLLGPPEFAGDLGNARRDTAESLSGPPARAGHAGAHRQAYRPGNRPADRLADLSYVVVDVETTGGRPFAGDRITEIAAVVVERGEVTRVYETLVNPERPIPPMITALTNISWNMVKNAPRFRDIVDEVTDMLRGHVFVAHNAAFDWRFVTSEVTRATGGQLDGRRLCTVRLARRVLPQLSRRSLDHVARHYDVEITGRHRAGGDARATARVLVRLLSDARDRGCVTWPELEVFLRTPVRARRRRRSAMPGPMDRDTTA